jgi:hypothetical protein
MPALVESAPQGATALPVLDAMPKEVVPGQAWILVKERLLCVAYSPSPGTVDVLTVPLVRDANFVQQFRMSEYVDFVLLLMLGIAIAFQMPLVILLLGWVGIVRPETLRKNRRYAIFILTIVAAIVTPTSDITSMVMMLVPLYGLYELGILLLVIAPPGAIAEGNVLTGFWRRYRSGKAARASRQVAQPAQSARGPQEARPARREPDGDADEGAAPGPPGNEQR